MRKNFILSHIIKERNIVALKHKKLELRHYYYPYTHIIEYVARGGQFNNEKVRGWDGFLHYYDKAVELFPDSADAHALYGFCFYSINKIKEALEYYNNSNNLEPRFFWTLYNLGVIHFQEGEYEAAANYLSAAVQTDFQYNLSVINKSPFYRNIWSRIKSPERIVPNNMINGYQQALKLFLVTLYKLKRYPEMISYANGGIKTGWGGHDDFYFLGALALFEMKRYPEAEQYIAESIKINGKHPGAYYYLGRILKEKGLAGESQEAFSRAEALGFDEKNPFVFLSGIKVRVF